METYDALCVRCIANEVPGVFKEDQLFQGAVMLSQSDPTPCRRCGRGRGIATCLKENSDWLTERQREYLRFLDRGPATVGGQGVHQGHGSQPSQDPRECRLNRNVTTLFHETSLESAAGIDSSGAMLRGTSASCGPGIYFAVTPEDARRKSRHHGVLFRCQVRLGAVKTLGHPDPSITHFGLLREGFDSIRLTAFQGDEFVVYNKDQVQSWTRV